MRRLLGWIARRWRHILFVVFVVILGSLTDIVELAISGPEFIGMLGQRVGVIEQATSTPTPPATATAVLLPTSTSTPRSRPTPTPTVAVTPTATIIPTLTPTPDSICYDVRKKVSVARGISDANQHDDAIVEAVKRGLPYKCFDTGIWAAGYMRYREMNAFILGYIASCAMYHGDLATARLAAGAMRDKFDQEALLEDISKQESNTDPNQRLVRLVDC